MFSTPAGPACGRGRPSSSTPPGAGCPRPGSRSPTSSGRGSSPPRGAGRSWSGPGELGAEAVINYRTADFAAEVRRLTGKRGVDVIFDHVGRDTWEANVRSLAKGGRLVQRCVFGAVRLSAMLTNAPLMASVISALTAVVFDYVLEPVAVRLGYWTWQPGGYTTTVVPALTGAAGTAVPVRNFVAWFVIAFAASLVYHGMHVRVRSRLPVYYLGVQFVFFLILLGGLVL